MAAEHEDRNKVVAAKLIEQQQRPLGRSREAKIREAGPCTCRASSLPAAHTAFNTFVCVCALLAMPSSLRAPALAYAQAKKLWVLVAHTCNSSSCFCIH